MDDEQPHWPWFVAALLAMSVIAAFVTKLHV
jgi:hypothetical protein